MTGPFAVLEAAARWATQHAFGLDPESRLGASVACFLYDVPEVMMLLIAISFAAGVPQTWLEPERVRRLLGGKRSMAGNVMAEGIGIFTPFCSCSAVPPFIGFLKGGVPLGTVLSFTMAVTALSLPEMIIFNALMG